MKYNFEYYNKEASKYDFTRKFFLFGEKQLIKLLKEIGGIDSLLEVGCGTGRFLSIIHNEFPEIKLKGIDLSEKMLEIARNKNPSISFELSDYFQLNSINSKFVLLSYFATLFGDSERFFNHLYNITTSHTKIILLDFYSFDSFVYRKFMKNEEVKSILDIRGEIEKYFNIEKENIFRSPYLMWRFSVSVLSKKAVDYPRLSLDD